MKPKKRSSGIHKKERSPEEQMVCLPICIIFEILSKLPAEEILKFRSVCKSWYALTHESCFITKQFQWSKDHEPSRYLFQVYYGTSLQSLSLLDINEKTITKIPFNQMMKLPMPTYPNQYKLSTYNIVSSCNGLVCLRPKEKVDNVIICNPITKDCLLLPSTTIVPFRQCMSYQLGFYFDNSSRKYKVIREFRFFGNCPSKFQMITVGENSWKDLVAPNYVVDQGFNAPVFWNDEFNWKLNEFTSGHGNNCILSFDLIGEKFFTIPFPTDQYDFPRNYQVIGLGGDLKIIEHHRSRFLKIWKVTGNKVEGFSLFLQYTYIFCVPPSRMLQYDVISGIDEETYLMQVNKCRLEIFSPKKATPSLQELDIQGLPPLFKIICFKPSLYSPFA